MTASSVRNAVFAGLFALLGAGSARAQDFERITTSLTDTLQTAIDLLPQGVNDVRLGIGPGVYPDFEGSRHSSVHAVPVVSLRYRDMIEVINNEVKVTAFNHLFAPAVNSDRPGGSLRIGPLVSLNFGRDEKDSIDLKGMGDVHTSLELGAFVSFLLPNDRFRVRLRQDIAGGHKGATLQFDYTRTLIRAQRMSLSGSLGLNAASAAAGLKDANAGINGNYVLTDNWTLFATVSYERLVGTAKNSPLIRLRGSASNGTASAFAVYGF